MVKQNFLTKMLLLFALVVGSVTSVWAEDFTETITLSEQNYSNAQEVASTVGEVVTLTYDQGTSSTAPAYYNTGTGVRVYAGGKMIVTANNNVITKVVVTFNKNNNPTISMNSNGTTTSAGTSSPATWVGSATQVFFNVTNAGHARIQKVEVTYTVSAIPTHTVTFSVNGVTTTDDVKEGAAIKFPKVTAPEGYTFLGWTKAEISGEQVSAPTDLLNEATMGTADITYYAVFAVVSGTPATLTKMVSGDTFSAGDNIVIVANVDSETAYALYQETQSTSYVKNYSFTADAETVGADDKNWLTVSAGSDGKWILGDATNGYLYNSDSNNLSIDINNSTDWTLEGNEDGTFKLKGSRYLSCRSDLSGANQYLFRMAGGTPLGVYNFDIYKFVAGNATYSNYCTTVPTGVTVTIASSGYTTLSSAHGLDFANATAEGAEDLIAYIIPSNNGVKLNKETVDEAAAGTGILLKGTPGATYSIPVKADAAEVGPNLLKAGPKVVEENNTTIYLLKSGKFHLASAGTTSVGKAYLELREDVGAPALSIDGDDETTGINLTTVNGQQATDGVYYDLSGRRVAQPTKGVFIVNGKKVVIK